MVFEFETSRNPDRTINRHRFICALKRLGIVDNTLSDRALKPAGTTPCVKALGALIADRSQVPFDQIASSSRTKPVVKARFQAIWVMRVVCGHSLTMIGSHMGNRDHTTILNSINKVGLTMETNMGYRKEMESLCEKADTIGVMQNRNILLRQSRLVH
nr:helix-turn-helix domain-containing protein [Defluviimonas salinarum]